MTQNLLPCPIPPRATRMCTREEETANWITHGIGLLLSIAAFILLIVSSCLHGDAWHVLSFTVYGISLVALYAASTIYHAVNGEVWKARLKRLDHAAIYLLIAGTYTPFMLTQLRDAAGLTVLGIVWALCGIGALLKLMPKGRIHPAISTSGYVLVGWLVLVVIEPLVAAIPRGGIYLLVAGGVSYTAGVIFYVWHRLRFHHAIWHAFVMGGSICHFLAVLLFLLPSQPK